MQGTNTLTKPRQKSKSHWGLIIVAMTIALLGGVGWMWWSRLTAMPIVALPTPTLPSPNAFDIFVEASKKLQEENKISEAISARPQHVYTMNEKAQLVAKNAVVLQQLRSGFQEEYYHPPIRSFDAVIPHFAKFRNMARLLAMEGEVLAARGEWNSALNSDLDAIQFGLTIPRGMPPFGSMVGAACEALGRKEAWKRVERLSAVEAKAGARRLRMMLEKRVPFSVALEEEKFALQASLQEMFRDPSWRTRSYIFDPNSKPLWSERVGNFRIEASLYLYSNATIFDNVTGYMDTQIARLGQPYITRSTPPPVPPDPVNQILPLDCDQAALKDLTAQTQDVLLLLALVLRAYRLEQGAYPQKLEALAPNYLTRLPEDPFGQGILLYKRMGDKYLLYSVGPDKTDDGGKPIDDPGRVYSSNPDSRSFVRVDSKGDIVSDMNRY